MRAIWGLAETCRKLESMEKKFKNEINDDLIEVCKEKLKTIYKKESKIDVEKVKF